VFRQKKNSRCVRLHTITVGVRTSRSRHAKKDDKIEDFVDIFIVNLDLIVAEKED